MTDVCLTVEGGYPDVTGGVSAWVDALVRALPDVDFTVARLAPEGGDLPAGPRYRPPTNVEVVRVPVEDAPTSAPADLPDARAYHALATGTASRVAAAAADARGRPMLLTEHGLERVEVRLGLPVGCKPFRASPRRGPREIARADRIHAADVAAARAYSRADAITTVCRHNLTLQRRHGAPAARTRVVVNPAPAASQRRDVRDGPPLVGFVGRVTAIKGVLTFVHAAAAVAEVLPDARFVVIGPLDHDPTYAERCVDAAERLRLDERLRFVGEVDPAHWYPRLDALVLPSRSEGQSLAAIEAMAAGVPVVASAVGGMPELLGGGAGALVAPADPEATASAILRLLARPELGVAMGDRGARRVAERHCSRRFRRAFLELYGRACDR